MIKKIIGLIMVVATIVVIIFTALKRGEYTSLFGKPATSEIGADTLDNFRQQMADTVITTCPADTLTIDSIANQ